jgi:hypothetical protein
MSHRGLNVSPDWLYKRRKQFEKLINERIAGLTEYDNSLAVFELRATVVLVEDLFKPPKEKRKCT